MAKLAIIADDLTGANDTAVQFAKQGISTSVKINLEHNEEEKPDSDVMVLNTDSRDYSSEEAYNVVKKAALLFRAQGIKHIYKKIDSTLRGNFGVEVKAVADVFKPELVVIAPAFPKNKRTTVGGYHFLEGVPLELTEIANAPKTPVHESYIPKMIAEQIGETVGLVPLIIIKKGPEAVRKEIEQHLSKGERWIVFDVAEDGHFGVILAATASFDNILWVGSAGLANHLPEMYSWSINKKKSLIKAEGPALLIAGSVSHLTQVQAKELLSKAEVRLVKINVSSLFEDEKAEIQQCVKSIREGLFYGTDVLLASGLEDNDIISAVDAGQQRGLSGKEISEYTAQAIARIVAELDLRSISGLILTGGDTAVHVLRLLKAEKIKILAEVAPGIPLGFIEGGVCSGKLVVTKAGAFGEKDCFLKALKIIKEEDGGLLKLG